jgi:hypothetical protein
MTSVLAFESTKTEFVDPIFVIPKLKVRFNMPIH